MSSYLSQLTLSPAKLEKQRNRILSPSPYWASAKAVDLHKNLLVVDLHADSLLWNRDLTKKSDYGQVDIPRLIEGNVALQVFSAVTKVPKVVEVFTRNTQVSEDDRVINNQGKTSDAITPLAIVQRWPLRTWRGLKERALYQAEKLHRYAKDAAGNFCILRTAADIDRYLVLRRRNSAVTAGLLAIEGGDPLEGHIESLDELFNAGFRMISPSHFLDSALGGSAHGLEKGGLTDLGREVLSRMELKGMIIDLAHASPKVVEDALRMVKKPVVVSHTGAYGVYPNPRNLTDRQIRGVARTGGLIGVGYFNIATGGTDVRAIGRSIRYVVDLVGAEHTALGSDFDGAVAMPFDTTGLVQITDALLNEGISEKDIRLIMGENVIRVLREGLPKD